MRSTWSLAAAVFAAIAVAVPAQEAASRSVRDGVYTEPQAERGKSHYIRWCVDCHGDELEGDVVEHPELAGGNFMDKWNGQNLGQLYERIHRDMPPGKAGSLSRQAAVELIAFILRANQFPAGDQELPQDPQLLKQIRIEKRKE